MYKYTRVDGLYKAAYPICRRRIFPETFRVNAGEKTFARTHAKTEAEVKWDSTFANQESTFEEIAAQIEDIDKLLEEDMLQ